MGELTTPKLVGIAILLGAAMLYGVALLSNNETVDTTRDEELIAADKQVELPVLFEEFGDFECPACGAYYPVLKSIKEEYGDKIDFKFVNYPLQTIHPNAFNASLAYEAAKDQGMGEEYHDALYENQEKLEEEDLFAYAEDLGLDMDEFKDFYESDEAKDNVNDDIKKGDDRGVSGTPTFYIEGDKVVFYSTDNPEQKLRDVLDAHIARAEENNSQKNEDDSKDEDKKENDSKKVDDSSEDSNKASEEEN